MAPAKARGPLITVIVYVAATTAFSGNRITAEVGDGLAQLLASLSQYRPHTESDAWCSAER